MDTEDKNIYEIDGIKSPNEKIVKFKFDNDEPIHLGVFTEGGQFEIVIRENEINFNDGNGKSFTIFVES